MREKTLQLLDVPRITGDAIVAMDHGVDGMRVFSCRK